MAVHVNRDDGVAVVTVDRPDALNALNTETNALLLEAVRGLSEDASVRAVVLTGGGEKSFVAGADIAEMKDLSADEARAFSVLGHQMADAIEGAPQPWIAAVNGFALGGGCELALACDIRLAAENAKFGQPEIGLAITPGFGGTQRLVRTVGPSWANFLVLSGRHIRADEALAIGLVTAVYPKDRLLHEATKLARELAAKSAIAMRACKQALRQAQRLDLTSGLRLEKDVFSGCFDGPDQLEGMTAFMEKRPPDYEGR